MKRALTVKIVVVAIAAALGLMVGISLKPAAAQAASAGGLGFYVGAANPGGISHMEQWLGATVGYEEDFLAMDDWSKIESPTWWLTAWKGSGRQLVLSVPMIPNTGGS